ncbi:MAG: helix-turn-helix domain-containing protein [Planctomycetes bacterium]|nr:helix-turn-helix domain-containing protein [Planctomycetota bacterium]
MSEILDTLRRMIRESGRTISDIADAADVNKSMLSKLMNHKVGLNVESVERVVKALGGRIKIKTVTEPGKRSK